MTPQSPVSISIGIGRYCHSNIGHRTSPHIVVILKSVVLYKQFKQLATAPKEFHTECSYPVALLELINQVVHEADKEFVGRQLRHPVFIVRHDQFQLLESVWKDVEYERRRVLDVHARMLTKLHHLVHHLPRLVDRFPVDRYQPLGTAGVGQRSLNQCYQFLTHIW